jgi:hypothetical protein
LRGAAATIGAIRNPGGIAQRMLPVSVALTLVVGAGFAILLPRGPSRSTRGLDHGPEPARRRHIARGRVAVHRERRSIALIVVIGHAEGGFP